MVKRFLRDRSGAAMAEYALILAIVTAMGGGTIAIIGNNVGTALEAVSAVLQGGGSSGGDIGGDIGDGPGQGNGPGGTPACSGPAASRNPNC
jgi:Flp pilus assembly pilin Flp